MAKMMLKILRPILKWVAENVRDDDPVFYAECVETLERVDKAVNKK